METENTRHSSFLVLVFVPLLSNAVSDSLSGFVVWWQVIVTKFYNWVPMGRVPLGKSLAKVGSYNYLGIILWSGSGAENQA